MNYYLVALIIVAALVTTACQPARVLNVVTPSGTYTLESNRSYGEHPRQQFDVYHPRSAQHSAVVVFVYGGAWEEGNKEDFEFIGQAFTRLGYKTIIPDYRVFPEVEFPDFIIDVAAAMRRYAEQADSDVEFILVGHSAGAHTAALLVTGGPRGGGEKILFFSGGVGGGGHRPPNLSTPERYAERLEALEVDVESRYYSRIRHVDMVASLASRLRFWSSAYSDIEEFLARLEDQRRESAEVD